MPYIILGVLLHHAPNGPAQAKMVEVYHQQYLNVLATHEDNQGREFEKVLVGILYDGLNLNVWPWDAEPSNTDLTTTDPAPTKTGTWGPWGEDGRQGK